VAPLAALLVGPVLDAVAPGKMPSDLLNSVLPTILPLATLVLVAAASYRRTGSAAEPWGSRHWSSLWA